MLFAIFFPIIISFLLGAFLIAKPKEKGDSKKMLGYFFLLFSYALFAISLNFIQEFLNEVKNYFRYIEIFFYPVMLALPVVVYFYITSLIHKNSDKNTGKKLFHLFIPIQSLIFNLIPNLTSELSPELIKKLDYTNFFSLKITFILLNVYYLIIGFLEFKRNSKRIKEEYSYEAGIHIKWMIFFVIGYVSFVICFFMLTPDASPFVVYIPFVMVSFYFYVQRFNQNTIELNLENDDELEKKDQNNFLSTEKKTEILESLIKYVEDNKIYLTKDLTIHDIAREIKINSNYISFVLNNDMKSNFATFINSYRINKAKEVLVSDEYSNLTIEAISEIVGFKSKSSFNNSFKNIVGKTPSEYKKDFLRK
jgi:AraC-like DNA-binding protein